MERPRARLRVGSWPGASYTRNSVIPTLCAALERRGVSVIDVSSPWRVRPREIDVFQIHWPEQVFWDRASHLKRFIRVGLTLAALARMRCFGVRVVWMVHNTEPHEADALSAALWRFYVLGLKGLTQQYIVLSPGTVPLVRDRLRLSPQAALASIRHPAYPRGGPAQTARANLGIPANARVYVFFGQIRPYKGLNDLLDAFGALPDPTARLIVAGDPQSPAAAAGLRARAKLDPRIELRLGYIEETTLTDIVDAADRVVLPFARYLHSGSLIRALSQGKITITPETPFARDLRDDVGEQWVRLYQGRLVAEHLADPREPASAPDMSAYEPDRVAEELLVCYRAVVDDRKRALGPAHPYAPR